MQSAMTDEILSNLNEKITCSKFLDLATAFDCINHKIQLKKLEKYGIHRLPLKLLTSSLSNRQQYTRVNNVTSNMNKIMCGVPPRINFRPSSI